MNEERLALVIAAIKALQPTDFTKSGMPNLSALKATITDITTEERDEAWEKLAEEKTAEAAPNLGTFDKTGATSVVTHRNGLKRVWFRDGKEIGVEDAGE